MMLYRFSGETKIWVLVSSKSNLRVKTKSHIYYRISQNHNLIENLIQFCLRLIVLNTLNNIKKKLSSYFGTKCKFQIKYISNPPKISFINDINLPIFFVQRMILNQQEGQRIINQEAKQPFNQVPNQPIHQKTDNEIPDSKPFSKGKEACLDSSSQRDLSIHRTKPISQTSRTSAKLIFPTSFKLDVIYNSMGEISRILRKEQAQMGLPVKYMKEILPEAQDYNQNILIRCRNCNAFVDFRCVNGKYSVAILRNRHTHEHQPKNKSGNAKQEQIKKMVIPPSKPIQPCPLPKPQFPPSNPNSLKSFIQQMKSSAMHQKTPAPSPFPNLPLRSSTPTAPLLHKPFSSSKFKQTQNFLLTNSFDLIVEQGRQPTGSFPEIMVVTSSAMKNHFQRYGDTVSFHITPFKIAQTSENGFNFQLCVFTVYTYHKRQLLAGFAFFCRQTVSTIRTIFESFLKMQGKHPESIVTTHEKEVYLAIGQLQEEKIYAGIHIVDSQNALHQLDSGIKVRSKITREIVDLCSKVVIERNRCVADKIISDIKELVEAEDDNTQKLVKEFLSQKQKLFVSTLPPAFSGFFEVFSLNRDFDDRLGKKFQREQPQTIDKITKAIVAFDSQLIQQSFDKITVYCDPIEQVFQDERLRTVRFELDCSVFRVFLQNYTEAVCLLQINPEQNAVQVSNMQTGETYKLADWDCACEDSKRTGLPCSHILAVAVEQKDMGYLGLIKKRWMQEVQEKSESVGMEEELIEAIGQKEIQRDVRQVEENEQNQLQNTVVPEAVDNRMETQEENVGAFLN